jgi:hypothetical protein
MASSSHCPSSTKQSIHDGKFSKTVISKGSEIALSNWFSRCPIIKPQRQHHYWPNSTSLLFPSWNKSGMSAGTISFQIFVESPEALRANVKMSWKYCSYWVKKYLILARVTSVFDKPHSSKKRWPMNSAPFSSSAVKSSPREFKMLRSWRRT